MSETPAPAPEAPHSPTETVVPAILPDSAFANHAKLLYGLLEKEATVETVQETEIKVFRGSLTDAFRKTNISMTYYTPLYRFLKEVSCITVLQRGARNVVSVVLLDHAPDEEDFTKGLTTGLLTMQRGTATVGLEQRIDALERLLGGINVVEALKTLEDKITERKV